MSLLFWLSTSMWLLDAWIFSDSSPIATRVRSTMPCPSSASRRASLACSEASAALRAISWAAAPSSLMAAATLSVRAACSLELVMEAFDACTTVLTRSCTSRVAEATSRIDLWMRSTKRLKASASSPNSSRESIDRRWVRSPSPSAMPLMAWLITCSGRSRMRISPPSSRRMATTPMMVDISADTRNSCRAAKALDSSTDRPTYQRTPVSPSTGRKVTIRASPLRSLTLCRADSRRGAVPANRSGSFFRTSCWSGWTSTVPLSSTRKA